MSDPKWHAISLERRSASVEAWARGEIAKIEADERFHYPTALVQVNAPLALEQVALKVRRQTLVEILDRLVHGQG